jgi:hypothetical protein
MSERFKLVPITDAEAAFEAEMEEMDRAYQRWIDKFLAAMQEDMDRRFLGLPPRDPVIDANRAAAQAAEDCFAERIGQSWGHEPKPQPDHTVTE